MAFDVAGVGASSVDRVYALPEWPQSAGPAAKLPIQRHLIACGGQTATAMAACAALGLRAAFLGVTGDDADGERMRAELTRRGVDVSHARIVGAQPYAVILLSAGSPERIVLWSGAAPATTGPLALPPSRVVHVDDTDEDAALAAAANAREAGRFVTTDIDRVTDRTRDLIGAATHPILAEHVPAGLTGEPDLAKALRLLRPRSAGPIVVTRGAAGAIALDDDRLIESPGFQVDAVDATGAGDIFRAGFIAALLEGRDLAGILRFANAAAAVSCETRGAFDSIPARDRVLEVLGAEC